MFMQTNPYNNTVNNNEIILCRITWRDKNRSAFFVEICLILTG